MLEGGKISGRQAVYLIVITILPGSVMLLPNLMYAPARQDAWLSVMLAVLFGLTAGEIIARIGRRFPGQTVIDYSRLLAGPFLGVLVGLGFAVFFIYTTAFFVREFAELITSNILHETPVVVFMTSTVIVAVYVVRHGLEVLARLTDMVLPVILIALFVPIPLLIPYFRLDNFYPVLENGFTPVALGAVPAAFFFAQAFVMLMLIPYMSRPRQARRVIARGVATTGVIQLLITLTIIGVLGPITGELLIPVVHLARQIRVDAFLSNLDPLIMLVWIAGGLVKIAVLLYCGTLAAAQVLRLKNYGPVAVVNGIVVLVLAVMLWKDAVQQTHQIGAVLPYFLLLVVGVPALLLLVAIIGGKGVKPRARR